MSKVLIFEFQVLNSVSEYLVGLIPGSTAKLNSTQ